MEDNVETPLSNAQSLETDEIRQKLRKFIGLPTLTLLIVSCIFLGLIPGLPLESLGYLIEASSLFMLFGVLSQLYFIYHDYQTWKTLKAEGLSDSFMVYQFSDFIPKTWAGIFILVLGLLATGVLVGLMTAFFLGNAAFLQPFFDAMYHSTR